MAARTLRATRPRGLAGRSRLHREGQRQLNRIEQIPNKLGKTKNKEERDGPKTQVGPKNQIGPENQVAPKNKVEPPINIPIYIYVAPVCFRMYSYTSIAYPCTPTHLHILQLRIQTPMSNTHFRENVKEFKHSQNINKLNAIGNVESVRMQSNIGV